MKKIIIAVVCIVIVAAVVLVACNVFGDGGLFSSKLAAPEVSVMGGVIMWDKVNNATMYEVYKNGVLVNTTSETHYSFEDITEDAQVYVVAIDEEESKTSESSSKVLVYQQSGFSSEESMTIELESGGYVIPANIKYVCITGNSTNAYITIADRTSDLIVSLNNVNLTSPEGKDCIATSDGEINSNNKRYTVSVKVNGINILQGGNCTSVPSQPSDNTSKKGGKGGDGGSCLVLPYIVFCGNGSLTLNGGNGGAGGKGADSSGWSTACYGNGGDGGNGGNGIETEKAVLAMSLTGLVESYGGTAGTKGAPGANGSTLSGALYTSSWKNSYGKEGTEGLSVLGDIQLVSGIYRDK